MGNRRKCSVIAHRFLNENNSINDLYEKVIKIALYEVGTLWEQNKISVAAEHLATAITEGILNELFEQIIANKRLNKNRIDPHKSLVIQFFADNNKDFIEFDIDEFLFIYTSGNHLDLYVHKNNGLIRKTFRSTLTRSLTFFADASEIIQCHRAFIVNTDKVINAKGNSQGLRLRLENCATEIPVSRSFVSNVKSKIS